MKKCDFSSGERNVELVQDVEEVLLGLASETYLIQLMRDYGHMLDYSDEVKEKAFEDVLSYQQQHVRDMYMYYDCGKLAVSVETAKERDLSA